MVQMNRASMVGVYRLQQYDSNAALEPLASFYFPSGDAQTTCVNVANGRVPCSVLIAVLHLLCRPDF